MIQANELVIGPVCECVQAYVCVCMRGRLQYNDKKKERKALVERERGGGGRWRFLIVQ